MTKQARPAVTFALFAYNQEAYVEEAIAGALAQQCDSMEIILSDDCSTDRTHAIMETMAKAYRGPHNIRVRREPTNAGTVQHVINVARVARGDLMVVAAGDDISYPDRAAILYQAWKDSGAAALSSWHDEIDAEGKLLRTDVSFPRSEITQQLFANEARAHRVDGAIQTLPGFCAAYPRPFWADLPDPPAKLLVEDGIASALIIFRGGRIERVPQSLIAYRLLDTSVSNRRGGLTIDEIQRREAKIDRHARDSVGMIQFIIAQTRRDGTDIHPHTLRKLIKGIDQNSLMVDSWGSTPAARWRRLANMRSMVELKFLLPRLAGLRAFAAARIWLEKRRNRQLAKAG